MLQIAKDLSYIGTLYKLAPENVAQVSTDQICLLLVWPLVGIKVAQLFFTQK